MQIGEFARSTGVSTKAVRYYERLGLLPQAEREASGYRSYGPDDLSRLRFIVGAKQLGLSLHDIGDVLDASAPHAVSCPHVLATLETRRDAIAEWVRRAQEVHDALDRTVRSSRRRLDASTSPEDACPVVERGLHERVRLTLDDAPLAMGAR